MPDAVRYREKSAQLRQQAEEAQNAGIREELIKLAEQYDEMARVIDAAMGRTPS